MYFTFPGANPTNVSNNACAVKIYNAKSNLELFENENNNVLLCKNASVVVVNSDVVGGIGFWL
jgi:hypothetical protein